MAETAIDKRPKSTIWIDLTDMAVWSGHYTGVQRVVYSYASRFADNAARFFIYDKIDSRHIEVPFSYLEDLKKPAPPPVLTKRQKVKRIVGTPYYSLPSSTKQKLRPIVRVSNSMARSSLHLILDKDKPDSPYINFPGANFEKNDIVVLLGAGWNEAGSLDVLCELRKLKGFKLVQHINDILPIYQPHLFADELPKIFTPYIETAVRNADLLTVISHATKRDVEIFCKHRNIDPPKIEVIRLGEDVVSSKPVRPAGVDEKSRFILSVGTFEIRKNYILLYQAAKLAQLEGRDFPNIVIVGRKGWLTEDLSHLVSKDPFTQGKIKWLSGLSDDEVNWLFENCMFSVFPSLCEGWGLPIVESLQHGKMCLTSNVSSMLEIGQGMVDYFSPYDARSCMEKILEYANDDGYEPMNARIKKEYRVYTWDMSYGHFQQSVSANF